MAFAMRWISAFPKQNPFSFNLGVATAKTSAADLMTQVVVEKKDLEKIDWRRNASFAVFGLVYLGGFQYWLQVNMFRRWFPGMDRFTTLSFSEKIRDIPGLTVVAKQIVFDVCIHLPFMYYPTFYVVKEAVQGKSLNPADVVQGGISKFAMNFVPDQTAMLAVWGPADIVIFSVPLYLRLPVRHIVSFGWTAFLSFTRGNS